ncbi:MAG: pseudouridine synthase, partial [Alkalinema sp. CAN_BIN05]|nr:pseudouridine synthase [Alkalinema sp. CAN_BIN05]
VYVEGHPCLEVLNQWRRGVLLEGRKTLPAEVNVIQTFPHKTLIEIVMREGRNRQIRRVAQQLGHSVIRLHRTAIGEIQLQAHGSRTLAPGTYRSITSSEMTFLKSTLHLPSITARGA